MLFGLQPNAACLGSDSCCAQALLAPSSSVNGIIGRDCYLQLGRCVCRKLKSFLANGEMKDDLHGAQSAPGSVTGVHLPQEYTKGVYINRLAELACTRMASLLQLLTDVATRQHFDASLCQYHTPTVAC